VEITAALAADLALLSECLDETDADIAETLRALVADVQVAVPAYLGLTIIARNPPLPLAFTVIENHVHQTEVASSLLIPLTDGHGDDASSPLVLILYAGAPGAFVDLAADLAWLTGRHLTEFALDQHLTLPADRATVGGVRAASAVNQAVGVLLGQGYTPEQAALEIDARAAAEGHSRSDAADVILGAPRSGREPDLDAR
jgi:hypothetical protein